MDRMSKSALISFALTGTALFGAAQQVRFARQPVAGVVGSIVEAIEADAFEVVRGGETRAGMLDLDRTDPAAIDARFPGLKASLEAAVRDHSAL